MSLVVVTCLLLCGDGGGDGVGGSSFCRSSLTLARGCGHAQETRHVVGDYKVHLAPVCRCRRARTSTPKYLFCAKIVRDQAGYGTGKFRSCLINGSSTSSTADVLCSLRYALTQQAECNCTERMTGEVYRSSSSRPIGTDKVTDRSS